MSQPLAANRVHTKCDSETRTSGDVEYLWRSGLIKNKINDVIALFITVVNVLWNGIIKMVKGPEIEIDAFTTIESGEMYRLCYKTLMQAKQHNYSLTTNVLHGKNGDENQLSEVLQKNAELSKSSCVDSEKRVRRGSKNIFLNGLSEKATINDLMTLFSKFGKVSHVRILRKINRSESLLYGFITMASTEEAEICIENLDRIELHGCIMRLRTCIGIMMKRDGWEYILWKNSPVIITEKEIISIEYAYMRKNSKHIYTSGLSKETTITDLKLLFSAFGKVLCADIVKSVKSPEFLGFITMASNDEVRTCIENLDGIQLHGRIIEVRICEGLLYTKDGEKRIFIKENHFLERLKTVIGKKIVHLLEMSSQGKVIPYFRLHM